MRTRVVVCAPELEMSCCKLRDVDFQVAPELSNISGRRMVESDYDILEQFYSFTEGSLQHLDRTHDMVLVDNWCGCCGWPIEAHEHCIPTLQRILFLMEYYHGASFRELRDASEIYKRVVRWAVNRCEEEGCLLASEAKRIDEVAADREHKPAPPRLM